MTSIHLPELLTEAAASARRFHLRLRLPAVDREDITQDLLLDLWRRVDLYDPEKGQIGPFAGSVLRHQSSRLASHYWSARRNAGVMVSLDEDSGTGSLGDKISETDGLSIVTTHMEISDRRLAILHLLAHLEGEDIELCEDLAGSSVSRLVREGRYSRSTLYRRLARLRLRAAAWGVAGWGAV